MESSEPIRSYSLKMDGENYNIDVLLDLPNAKVSIRFPTCETVYSYFICLADMDSRRFYN
jgi:hypothetical protein